MISLELKDLARLPAVNTIIEKVSAILSLFWGRKRWPRARLREVILANHGRRFGLYRAKQTRFAGTLGIHTLSPFPKPKSALLPTPPLMCISTGKFREMSRLLRVKADLQQVVVSADYASHRFSSRGRTVDEEEGETLDPGIGPKVKSIVLDDDGFWTPLTHILHVAMPLIKLLRMMDGNKPCIGKVYDKMFTIGERIKRLGRGGVAWAGDMSKKHADRWEYLHSPFHAAAYALDPEFMDTVGELDAATQEGLLLVFERMCLRDEIALCTDPDALSSLTVSSPAVIARVAQVEREFSVYQRREGVFSRPTVLANAKTMEPAAWWSMYGRHLPLLSAIAPRVLAQPAAASAAERNWSVYGQIRTAQKSRMHHGTADKLVYCHESMHLQQKLQDAGWAPDVERWESDEDSDGSEEEDDHAERLELAADEILRLCQ